jgi:type IV pilus assembly protein PilF
VLTIAACTPRQKRDPDQSQIHYQLAADSFRNRRIEAAMDELHHALELDPENADIFNLMGLISLQQGAEYLAQVETDTCLRGRDAEAVRRDATAKFRDAEQKLSRATDLRPKFSEAWNNLSVAALQLQSYDEAANAARSALKDVTYAEPEVARANLGWALYQKKDIEGAWKELHEAASRAPGFCVGRYRLAKVYVDRGDYERAAEELDAVAAAKQCPIQEAFLLAGLVQQRRKDLPRAKDLFGRCVNLAPRSCLAAECKRYGEMVQ